MLKLWLAAALGCAALASSARAELTWENKLLLRQGVVGNDFVTAQFAFRNATQRAITITQVKPSCGGMTATPNTYRVGPGEKGVLDVLLDGRGLVNLQEKTIQVSTDDKPGDPTLLTLRVTLPYWLQIAPQFLTWPVGSDPVAKEAVITLSPADALKIKSVKVSDAAFRATLVPTKNGQVITLRVEPVSTQSPHDSTVSILVESSTLATQGYLVVTRVR